MRPILVSLGPWQPYIYPILVVVIALFVVAWRQLERRLGDEVPKLTAGRAVLTGLGVLAAAAGVYVLVNKLAPVEIKAYGTMLVLAFAAGIWWMSRTAPSEEMSVPDIFDVALFILLGSIIGARVVFVALNWSADYATSPTSALSVWEGGLAFHGGIGGALLGGWLYCLWRKQKFWRLADLVTPSIPLGYAITRIGCFLNGCCYGVPTDLPWGVVFPDANIGGIPTPRHPTQLYAIAANLVIFAIIAKLSQRTRPTGHLFLIYLLFYSIYRFFIEFLRRGATAVAFEPLAPLTQAQVASIAIAVVSTIVLLVCRGRDDAPTP